MADITMCGGENCPMKEKCYRFTAPKDKYMQSYFAKTPLKNGVCPQFWFDSRNQKGKTNE